MIDVLMFLYIVSNVKEIEVFKVTVFFFLFFVRIIKFILFYLGIREKY